MQRTDIDTSQVLVFGRSLGGAVGAVLAQNNPDKVILEFVYVIFVLIYFWLIES